MVATNRAAGLMLVLMTFAGCMTPEKHAAVPLYFEHDGMWCTVFPLGFEEARVGVRNTLADLKMPLLLEGPDRRGTFIDTKTPDDFEARILILPGRHAEGTRVCVRIGGFGTHRKVCERLLDDIGRHMQAVRNIYTPAPPAALPISPSPNAAMPALQPSQPSLPSQPVPVGQ